MSNAWYLHHGSFPNGSDPFLTAETSVLLSPMQNSTGPKRARVAAAERQNKQRAQHSALPGHRQEQEDVKRSSLRVRTHHGHGKTTVALGHMRT